MTTTKFCEITTQLPEGILTPGKLMHILEDAADRHVSLMGASTEDLHRNWGAFWMLTRCLVRLNAPITGPGELKCVTNHREVSGVMIYRDFDLYFDGKPVGEAIQAWIIARLSDRKMLRPAEMEPFQNVSPDSVKSEKLPKLKTPEDLKTVKTYTVAEGDIDVNGHMNNTRYVSVAETSVNCENVREFRCGFLKECRLGDVLTVGEGNTNTGKFVRITNAEGEPCFHAEFVESAN